MSVGLVGSAEWGGEYLGNNEFRIHVLLVQYIKML